MNCKDCKYNQDDFCGYPDDDEPDMSFMPCSLARERFCQNAKYWEPSLWYKIKILIKRYL